MKTSFNNSSSTSHIRQVIRKYRLRIFYKFACKVANFHLITLQFT
uniref:Uncharacterized protein n=1 Tax=Ascaris lumbricoides TaxID=6252 RepID=A0A0M3IAX4_ASCLU